MKNKGYARKDGKWSKILDEFKPHNEYTKSGNILNLDCARNKEDAIIEWVNEIILLISTDDRFSNLSLDNIKGLILMKTAGDVRLYLTSISDEMWYRYVATIQTNQDFARLISELISREFTKYEYLHNKIGVNNLLHENAKSNLNKMQICDMCQIGSFICEYQKYYYQLDNASKDTYKELFMDKLPYPLNIKINNIWKTRLGEIANTLGGVIRIVYEEMRNRCLNRETIRQLNRGRNEICCHY